MKIAILHNAVADSDSLADRDVLVQVAAVEEALRALGHAPRRVACTLNLEAIEESLTADRPDLVFNLVESLGGSDRLAHLAAVLLDDLDIPYTGTRAAALHLTNNKPLAKERLRASGLPTPDWAVAGPPSADEGTVLAPPYIIKAVWEHASVGLDDHAVVTSGDGSTVIAQIESRTRQLGRACFAEQFITGREFNLSLIATGDGPRVLPPAEIDFSAFPKDKPHIVGYSAKWVEDAFEFAHTPRRFDFSPADAPLLDWMRSLAVQCWQVFDLAGYARVDFRVDSHVRPWILEVNANPCLSPDAGFAAALSHANLPLERAVEWIVEDALRGTVERGQGTGVRGQESGVSGLDSAHGDALTPHPSPPTTHYSLPTTHHSPPTDSRRRPTADSSPPAPPLSQREREKKGKRAPAPKWRTEVQPADRDAIRQIVESTGLFRLGEIDVAVELVDARLAKGSASGYEFVLAEQKGQIVGYVCFGKNTLTVSSYDAYWIAVEKAKHGQGIGRLLLEEVERQIAAAGGTRIYIETSHRADYQATRGFYERCGYQLQAILEDFYAPGDSKAIYVKGLGGK